MMGFAQTSQPGTYGAQATWLSGTLSNFDGIPIVLTSKISETLSDAGLDDGADGTDMSGILCVHTPSFKIGHRRGITVEAEKQATVQQVFVVASQRASFQKIAKSTDIPVAYGFQIYTA